MQCELIDYRTSRGEVVLFCIQCGEYVEEPCDQDNFEEQEPDDE